MKIVNKKFGREYEMIEAYEAGIALTGAEVKSIRDGRMKLDDAYVKIVGNEPYLLNAEIYPYRFEKTDNQEAKRSRKLLLHKKEIVRIKTKMRGSGKLTIAPVSCYNKGRHIKLEIALVRGRRDVEKRKLEKQKKIRRQDQKEVKEYVR